MIWLLIRSTWRSSIFLASGTTPQTVVEFQPSPEARQRALALLELAKEDRLTPEQASELEHLTELEHILRMAKARARQILANQS